MITSKHITDFKPSQIPQIIVWAQEKCKVPATKVEHQETKVVTETVNGTEYLKELNVAGRVINPTKLNF